MFFQDLLMIYLMSFQSTPNVKRDGFIPSVDISETSDQFEFLVGLPGLLKKIFRVILKRASNHIRAQI